jgi:hypothetical protein
MPVIGDSGTGKSHLVRWVKERTPSTDLRHVIYLEKMRTSLKAVVTTLLEGASGEPFDAIRADVANVGAQFDQAGLEQRLLNNLQEQLTAAEPPSGPARVLAGPRGLAVLLLDPHVRDHLLQPGRLIPRLAEQLLADRHEGGSERPLLFTIDDLPLTISRVEEASQPAQRLLGVISTRPDDLQPAAVELLNMHLSTAVMHATNLGVGRLHQALVDIRRELARQAKEIILLIEDFALIQGIQRDLLDAMIETGVRDGRTVLAPIRTLLAVTTGYYSRLVDTVLTRARAATPYVYDLDAQFDESENGIAETLSFVGRYLNAARVGQESLDRGGVRRADDAENACPTCPMVSDCHAGFGVTEQGHGLYPFNRSGLLRAIHSHAPPGKPQAFNPRAILGQVVRNILVEHAASIGDGSFPDGRFRQEYPTADIDRPLPSAVRNAVDEADPTNAERRATLLEFWGDAPRHLTNLVPEVHRAFDLPLLDISEQPAPTAKPQPRPTESEPTPATDSTGHLPSSVRKAIADVEAWQSRNAVLLQQTALAIRTIIGDAVLRRCQWNDPPMPEPKQEVLRRAWPAKSVVVSIEGAAAENLPGTADAPIKFIRSAKEAVFFQGLLEADAGNIAGNGRHIRRLHEIAARHQRDVVQSVQRARAATDDQLVIALRAALLGAVLAGRAHPEMTDAHLMNAALSDGRAWTRVDAATRTSSWAQTWQRHQSVRPGLVEGLRMGFGVQRGVAGQVRMIDAARAMPLLRQAATGWTWQTPRAGLPEWMQWEAVAGFANWDSLIDAQVAHLASQMAELRTYLPRGTRAQDVVQAVADAVRAGVQIGHPPGDLPEFRELVAAAGDLDWKSIAQLERDLERAARASGSLDRDRQALVTIAAADRGDHLPRAVEFLKRADAWLTEALAAAEVRQSTTGRGSAGQMEDLLRQWTQIRGEVS